jgi:hypothetical protein
MMTCGQIPINMADIQLEPRSTSFESVSVFVKRLQGLVTSSVTSIDQANKTAEWYANRSRRDFQFGVGDADTSFYQVLHTRILQRKKKKVSSQVRWSLREN